MVVDGRPEADNGENRAEIAEGSAPGDEVGRKGEGRQENQGPGQKPKGVPGGEGTVKHRQVLIVAGPIQPHHQMLLSKVVGGEVLPKRDAAPVVERRGLDRRNHQHVPLVGVDPLNVGEKFFRPDTDHRIADFAFLQQPAEQRDAVLHDLVVVIRRNEDLQAAVPCHGGQLREAVAPASVKTGLHMDHAGHLAPFLSDTDSGRKQAEKKNDALNEPIQYILPNPAGRVPPA